MLADRRPIVQHLDGPLLIRALASRRWLLAGAGLAILFVVAAWTVTRPPAVDPRVAECQVNSKAKVLATFEMAHAGDYKAHIPKMGDSPELDDSRPAFVVIFDGQVQVPTMGGQQGGNVYDQVVCVLVDHVQNLYADVDTTGYTP